MKSLHVSSFRRRLAAPELVSTRRNNPSRVSAVLLAVAALTLCLGPATGEASLVITEVMSASQHPAGTANGDWWELTNTGLSEVNVGSYSWADASHLAGSTIFPMLPIAAGESVVIVNENAANLPGFRTAWGLSVDIVTISKDDFTGTEGFHRFNAAGDEVNLYGLDDELITMVNFGVANPGTTFEWARGGQSLGTSVAGEFGAYVAPQNGVGGPGLDVGSPGLSTWLLGDVNLDGQINGLDVQPFVDRVALGTYQGEADVNLDGSVNGLDVEPFVAAVVGSSGAMAVPEPSAWVLIGLAAAVGGLFGGARPSKRGA